jgi:hypothetical protein
MADLEIGVPKILGLSEEQQKILAERAQDLLIDVIKGAKAEARVAVAAKAVTEEVEVKVKAK